MHSTLGYYRTALDAATGLWFVAPSDWDGETPLPSMDGAALYGTEEEALYAADDREEDDLRPSYDSWSELNELVFQPWYQEEDRIWLALCVCGRDPKFPFESTVFSPD